VATILERATSLGVDLIVMGTHGASGVQHLLLGSVTEKVLRKATCPVLTVPARVHGALAASFTHVLCAVDFSDCSREAVKAAAAIVEGSPAKLTLLHVMEWPWHEPPVPGMEGVPPPQVQALLEYRRYLETSAADGLKGIAAASLPGRDVTTAVRFGKSYRELLDAAREGQVDLIVLGVRGRSAVDIGFFGSTTNHVVRGATCPVLTVGDRSCRHLRLAMTATLVPEPVWSRPAIPSDLLRRRRRRIFIIENVSHNWPWLKMWRTASGRTTGSSCGCSRRRPRTKRTRSSRSSTCLAIGSPS
jgi:nucleotide-binding universal stress UspA family protein